MDLLSLKFAALALIACVAMATADSGKTRAVFLLGFSGYFLSYYIQSTREVLLLGAFLASGYALYLLCLRMKEDGKRKAVIVAGFIAQIAIYAIISKTGFFKSEFPSSKLLAGIPALIGVSYIILRQLHLCVDTLGGAISRVSALEYLSYMLSFHTLLAGPIMRFQDFQGQLNNPRQKLSTLHIAMAVARITTGMVKKYVIAAELEMALMLDKGGYPQGVEPDILTAILLFHIFALYEYLDFSGYCDIMIGVGSLMGIKPPENFNHPYISRNIIELWTRWHITLSQWIRDYVFMPLSLRLARLTHGRYPLAIGFISFTIAFFIVGLWHNIAWRYILWGVSQGAAMGVVKIYDSYLRKALSREKYRSYQRNSFIRIISTFITIEFFVFSIGMTILGIWIKLPHLF